MKRIAAREIAVRLCFSLAETPSEPEALLSRFFDEEYYSTLKAEDDLYAQAPDARQLEYITRLVKGVYDHAAELDGYIDRYSVGWKYGRISRTAAAIIKTAMYEALYMPDIPDSAAINEAVELAKRYESPETVPFINGVLVTFVRTEKEQ